MLIYDPGFFRKIKPTTRNVYKQLKWETEQNNYIQSNLINKKNKNKEKLECKISQLQFEIIIIKIIGKLYDLCADSLMYFYLGSYGIQAQ